MATTASSKTMTFPRPIFAAVDPRACLGAHLAAKDHASIRANGRTATESRTPGIHTGSLTHSNGSAVVRLGNTTVVCGVRGEILDAADLPGTTGNTHDIEALRLLVPNVELSTGSTPQHIPGNAPSTAAQSLITRLRSLLHATRLLSAEDLRIAHTAAANAEDPDAEPEEETKGFWVLYMDVFFISVDGAAFDAAWIAMLAALRDTKLPRAFFDEEAEKVLCSDARSEARPLNLRGLPVPASYAAFEGSRGEDKALLSDPDAFEEGVCKEVVCVVVDYSGGEGAVVRRIEKSGGGGVGRAEMSGLVERARGRWDDVRKALEAV